MAQGGQDVADVLDLCEIRLGEGHPDPLGCLGDHGAPRVGDQAVTERRYRITREGARLWAEAHRFYDELARLPAKVRWSDA